MWQSADTSACLLAKEKDCRKSVEIQEDYRLGLPQAALKRSQFKFHRHIMGPAGGLMGLQRKCQSRYTVWLGGRYVADGQHTTGKDLFITWLAYSLNA